MKDMFFSVTNNGIKKEYEIIKNVKYNDSNYIVYKEKDNLKLYASKYEIVNNELVLSEIDNEDVYEYLDSVMEG